MHVHVKTIRTIDSGNEVKRMWKEHSQQTQQAIDQSTRPDEDLHGETTYDLSPSTTMEYDIVACEDYVEDKGCWVRNMPEEIARVNPDFVPS
jgi:hypothetical protein